MKKLFFILTLISFSALAAKTPVLELTYYVPSDVVPNESYMPEMERGAREVQEWLKNETGKTFELATPPVRLLIGKASDSELSETQYNIWPSRPDLQWFSNVTADVGRSLRIGEQGLFDGLRHKRIRIIYADSNPFPGLGKGSGGGSFAIVPREDLEGIMGRDPVWPRSRWIGGIAHEMLHAMGLPHSEGCDDKNSWTSACETYLMHGGYVHWPRSVLDPGTKSWIVSGGDPLSKFFLRVPKKN